MAGILLDTVKYVSYEKFKFFKIKKKMYYFILLSQYETQKKISTF